MSKFNFEYMTDGNTSVVVFNKKLWTKEDAIIQARIELDLFDIDDIHYIKYIEMEIFTSYTSYGYYLDSDDQVQNGWHIPNCHDSYLVGLGENYKVPVWVVKVKEVAK